VFRITSLLKTGGGAEKNLQHRAKNNFLEET